MKAQTKVTRVRGRVERGVFVLMRWAWTCLSSNGVLIEVVEKVSWSGVGLCEVGE